jgi:hypothetical protein
MKWIKPFEQLPEKEDYAEMCFSLQEMIDAFRSGTNVQNTGIYLWFYFFKNYNIDINKYEH